MKLAAVIGLATNHDDIDLHRLLSGGRMKLADVIGALTRKRCGR